MNTVKVKEQRNGYTVEITVTVPEGVELEAKLDCWLGAQALALRWLMGQSVNHRVLYGYFLGQVIGKLLGAERIEFAGYTGPHPWETEGFKNL